MAVTTEDLLIAGWQPPVYFEKISPALKAAGAFHSLFYSVGKPGHAIPSTAGVNGEVLTTYAGQIPYSNPGAGSAYIGHLTIGATIAGSWKLYDLLWHNNGLNPATTTEQTFTQPTLPARCIGGNTNGKGIYAGLVTINASGNGSPITNTTIRYTNSIGTTSRVGTIASVNATSGIAQFFPFDLNAGDYGIRSIQGVTLGTSYGAGTEVALVLFRHLMMGAVSLADRAEGYDAVTGGFTKCYNNTVPFLVWTASATTAVTVRGLMAMVHG